MTTEFLSLDELGAADYTAWNRFRVASLDLKSPYFSLAYLKMVDAVRPGVRIARFKDAGQTIGFLPYRLDALGVARPVGGTLCDLHGPVAAPDHAIDFAAAFKAGPVRAYAFSASPYANTRHGLGGVRGDGNHVMDLGQGYDAYIAGRDEVSSEFRRIRRKAERVIDAPDTRIQHDVADTDAFNRLVELKRENYAAAGHFDIFSLPWPKQLLEHLLTSTDPSARGVLSTLHVKDERAAILFGMRSDTVLHYWFPAYELAFAKKNVGHALLFSLAEWAASEGIEEIHLGLGNYRYKAMMSSWRAPVREGVAAFRPLHALGVRMADWSHAHEAAGGLAEVSARICRKVDRVCTLGTLAA